MSITIPRLLQNIAHQYPDHSAQLIKDEAGAFHPRTWEELRIVVDRFAAGLKALGADRGTHIGLISENRAEWFVADLATMTIGAADVPRGNDATNDELAFILGVTETAIVCVENDTQRDKVLTLKPHLSALKHIVQLDDQYAGEAVIDGVEIANYADLVTKGAQVLEESPDLIETERDLGNEDDTVTVIFTSGTTGEPKGVMLSHLNFLHQVENVPKLIDVGPEDIWLCVLPVWHSFERIMQYVAMGRGSALAYSKPIGKIMLEDFQKVRPTWMASVPRIWEAIRAGIYRNVKKQSATSQKLFGFFVAVGGTWASLRDMFTGRLPRFYRRVRLLDALVSAVPLLILTPLKLLGDVLVFKKIRARLGGRFKAGISGGGALPAHVDRFFSAAGILLLEGYGLTETAPVLGVRAQNHPVPGTVGPVFPGTEVRIIGEDGSLLGPGKRGVVYAKGPQVMKGYYKRPDLTAEILSEDGWINTGDLGMLTWDNELKITGRAKDTIVLLGGENIEPAPIEERLRASEFIAQAVVLGQDQKFLAVLIVPDFDTLQGWTESEQLIVSSREALVEESTVQTKYNQIIANTINTQNGFKSFEQIYRFHLLPSEFVVGEELSAKQEIKRHVIAEKYATEIAQLFQ